MKSEQEIREDLAKLKKRLAKRQGAPFIGSLASMVKTNNLLVEIKKLMWVLEDSKEG